MPYDKFVAMQLAGDLLPYSSQQERRENLVATGYIANSRRFGSRVDGLSPTSDDRGHAR